LERLLREVGVTINKRSTKSNTKAASKPSKQFVHLPDACQH
jgi:hypothetical protein